MVKDYLHSTYHINLTVVYQFTNMSANKLNQWSAYNYHKRSRPQVRASDSQINAAIILHLVDCINKWEIWRLTIFYMSIACWLQLHNWGVWRRFKRQKPCRNCCIQFPMNNYKRCLMNGGPDAIKAAVERIRNCWTEHIVEVNLSDLNEQSYTYLIISTCSPEKHHDTKTNDRLQQQQ